MEIIADLQIHSKYARAVSKFMELPFMHEWAVRKGLSLLGTGDWQHPAWLEHIKNNLVEVDNGIFQMKSGKFGSPVLSSNIIIEPKFLLQSEVSCIYSQEGKGRRVHHLIFSPSIKVCEDVIKAFITRGWGSNIEADGRPILPISSRDLLDMLLSINPDILLIPAHVWTPWFGMYGSKSGFDSIEECFGDLSSHIYAVETGLSSDPAMNWGIEELKNRSIVSFSDAHSAPKMGRECTVFHTTNEGIYDTSYTYYDFLAAIKQEKNSKLQISRTIEFFPEEGKYHLSGHRAHGIVYTEQELNQHGVLCPVCGKKLTLGVEHRVCSLSKNIYGDKDLFFEKDNELGLTYVHDSAKMKKPFISLIPLLEILQEVYNSKVKAEREYQRITDVIPEFELLLKSNFDEISYIGGEALAEAVMRVRSRMVQITPGYDGVFGKVSLFTNL